MTGQQLRPLRLGDIFDEAFDLYKQNFLLLLLVAALTVVPAKIVISGFVMHYLHTVMGVADAINGTGDNSPAPDPAQMFAWLTSAATGAAILLPLGMVTFGIEVATLSRTASARYLGQSVTPGQVYRETLRRIFPLFITILLTGAMLLFGYVLCLVPALIVAVLVPFTAHAFVVEHKSYGKAIGRSYQLVSGESGRVLGCLLLGIILYAIMSLAIEMPFNYVLDMALRVTPGTHDLFTGYNMVARLSRRDQIISQVGSGFSELMIAPFLISLVTVLYFDLRVRKEAFDIDCLAEELQYPPLSQLPGYLPPATMMPPLYRAPVPPPVRGGRRR